MRGAYEPLNHTHPSARTTGQGRTLKASSAEMRAEGSSARNFSSSATAASLGGGTPASMRQQGMRVVKWEPRKPRNQGEQAPAHDASWRLEVAHAQGNLALPIPNKELGTPPPLALLHSPITQKLATPTCALRHLLEPLAQLALRVPALGHLVPAARERRGEDRGGCRQGDNNGTMQAGGGASGAS